MKILKQNSSELVLKSRPSGCGILFTTPFIIFPLIAVCGVLYQIGITTLKCKRIEPTQVSCEIQQSKFFGLVQQPPARFSQVKSAKFKSEEGTDSEGDRTIDNWVTLITNSAEVTVIEDYTRIDGVRGSASEMQALATQINNFIQSNQPSLQIQRDLRGNFGQSLFPLGFLSIIVLIGATVLFMQSRSETVIFDKNTHRLIREQKSLLGKKYRYYPFDEIKGVDIETSTDSDNDTFYVLRLLPKFTHKSTLMSSRNLQEVKNIQTAIHDFLQLL